MLKQDLSKFRSLFSGYTELRVQENRFSTIQLVGGNLVQNVSNSSTGVCARTYKNGSWGFASSSVIDDDSVKAVINASKENALFLDNKKSKGQGPIADFKLTNSIDFTTKKNTLSRKDKIDYIKEIDSYIATKYPQLFSRVVMAVNQDYEKNLVVSGGVVSYSMIPRTYIIISLTTMKDGKPITYTDYTGKCAQFEDFFLKANQHFKDVDLMYIKLMEKAEGEYAEAGAKTCILDSSITGILAHEAIGHTCEADFIMTGSIAADYLNKEVGSPLVSLVDFANNINGETLGVPVFVDDEGTLAQDATIIENGILKGYLHNKESALHFGVKPTGNAKAYDFSDEPLIRMRNTAILPGKSKLADMIASVEDGYYMTKTNNGQADSTGEFMFGVTMGYRIKNGKLGKAIQDVTISGVAFDLLKTVDMVSDEMTWNNVSTCGKKQPMPVGMGGPAIKCIVNIGGR